MQSLCNVPRLAFVMQNMKYSFIEEEIENIRSLLLEWYNKNKRDLPWRRAALNTDQQQHAYAVWVSEIMLQQTRVATVINYYKKWMSRWPTLADLSKASREEVNEIWAGLGYYSRGRRLHEGAAKVMNSFDGMIPQTSSELVNELPGVGKYTAAAIASIAFDESVGVLDGNVIRVLCRLLTIGGDSTSKKVLDHLWLLVDDLIPEENAGDFNQAMMELGALVCTPKNASCTKCPLKSVCKAYKQVENHSDINGNKWMFEKGNCGSKKRKYSNSDAENAKKQKMSFTDEKEHVESVVDVESCADYLCLPVDIPWDPKLGVLNYPRRPNKKKARDETTLVSVIEVQSEGKVNSLKSSSNSHFLLVQRPDHGLLAGLWEFPSKMLNENEHLTANSGKFFEKKSKTVLKEFSNSAVRIYLGNCDIEKRRTVGEMTHIFSHIHMKYVVEHIVVRTLLSTYSTLCEHQQKTKWVTKDELANSAVSSAMHKIYGLCFDGGNGTRKPARTKVGKEDHKQIKLDKFFKIKSEE